jgi:hypothetical protein
MTKQNTAKISLFFFKMLICLVWKHIWILNIACKHTKQALLLGLRNFDVINYKD